jgi:DNA segregation ATPase FtsK/SpoIIIE-like protein
MDEEDLAARPSLSSFTVEDSSRDMPSISNQSWAPNTARSGATTQRPGAPQQAFWDREMRDAANSRRRDDDDEDVGDDDDGLDANGEDAMYDEAVELVRRLNKASVSLLQRRLRIGYTRAARLIDIMEERGVVGPAQSGSQPRDVLPRK